MKKQTILGAGGAIGIELAKALKFYTNEIRLVSRNPKKVNETDELFPADILDKNQLREAVKDSKIVYVTVGFKYSYKIWKQQWPKFVSQLLEACEDEGCKLVFFDNIYMYDKDYLNGMTENTPLNPPSKKGCVRLEILEMILKKIEKGQIKGLIARSADFYGPSIESNSLLTEMVFKPLSQGKTANWFVSLSVKHSFTYTPDAAKATALLGNTEKAFGQVWHLPTDPNVLSGNEYIDLIAHTLGAKPKSRILKRHMIRFMGIFSPIMKEFHEMLYQYDRDYVFDSSKIEKEFGLKPTTYQTGINEIIQIDYR